MASSLGSCPLASRPGSAGDASMMRRVPMWRVPRNSVFLRWAGAGTRTEVRGTHFGGVLRLQLTGGEGGRFPAIGDAELAEHALDVGGGGLRGDEERLRDLRIGQAPGEQPEDFALPRRETVWISHRLHRSNRRRLTGRSLGDRLIERQLPARVERGRIRLLAEALLHRLLSELEKLPLREGKGVPNSLAQGVGGTEQPRRPLRRAETGNDGRDHGHSFGDELG